jgi:hypothetical protein
MAWLTHAVRASNNEKAAKCADVNLQPTLSLPSANVLVFTTAIALSELTAGTDTAFGESDSS